MRAARQHKRQTVHASAQYVWASGRYLSLTRYGSIASPCALLPARCCFTLEARDTSWANQWLIAVDRAGATAVAKVGVRIVQWEAEPGNVEGEEGCGIEDIEDIEDNHTRAIRAVFPTGTAVLYR